MTSLSAIPWATVLDVFQIGLCAALLAYLLRSRIKTGRSAAERPVEGAAPVFARDMLMEVASQNVAQALDAIAGTVEAERQRLQRGFGIRPVAAAGAAGLRFPGDGLAPSAPRCDILNAEGRPSGRYRGVAELAASGLSARQIADRLDLPEGEVELVLKLPAAPFGRE